MGIWREHFHPSVWLRWEVLGWILATVIAIAGLLLFFDQYTGANVCFALSAFFVFAKIIHVGVTTNEALSNRLLFTFVLFGLVGIGIVETIRGVNHWAEKKEKQQTGTSDSSQPHEAMEKTVDTPKQPLAPKEETPRTTEKAEVKPQHGGAKDTAKTTKPEPRSSSTESKAGHPPIFTFHDKSPDFFTLLMGNATINLAKGMLTQKGGWHGFANIDGYEPLTIYVKDDTLHIDAFVQDSSGQVTFKIENGGEDVTVLPPRWDRNFTNNELEIVDEKEVPVFQMVVHRPSVIELSAIFYGTRGSVFSARPKSKLFKYPSWEHSGERASQ